MFKKVVTLLLVVIMTLSVTIGGTIAYLTDRDSEANVFTVGDVKIDLTEDFTHGTTLLPGGNVTKAPKIANTGKNDAWVWAKIAVPTLLDTPADASQNVIHFNYAKESVVDGLWNWWEADGKTWMVEEGVEHDGIKYNVYTVLYDTILKPGEETEHPVMTKVYLDTKLDIDPDGNWYIVKNGVAEDLHWNTNEEGSPIMHVSAYAIQAQGFETARDAYNAYNTQWADNGDEWGVPGNVGGTEANENLAEGTNYLPADSNTNFNVEAGVTSNLQLQGNTLNGSALNNGTLTIENGKIDVDTAAMDNYGDATLNDVVVDAGSATDYAYRGMDGSTNELNNVELTSAGGGIGAINGAKVTFNSGSVEVDSKSTSGRYLFYAEGAGSEITINGGNFDFNKTQNQKRAYICAMDGTKVYVNGGTFGKASTRSGYSDGILTYGTGEVIITGGTFGFNPTKWVADGYQAVETDGVWTVSAK